MTHLEGRLVYVGGGDGFLRVHGFDEERGLGPEQARVSVGAMPSFFCERRADRALFGVNEDADALVACSVDRGTRLPRVENHASCPGGPAYVSLDRSEHYVFAANYGGGTVGVFRIDERGGLCESQEYLATGQHPHSIVADPTNRWVLVPNKGSDTISILAFDAEAGSLRKHDEFQARSGSGPRHLVFHPKGHFVYVINEDDSTVTVLRFHEAAGKLESIDAVSTLPSGATPQGNTGADLHVHPSGRFLYGSNRGHDSIAVFTIDEVTGRLSQAGHSRTGGTTPRHFALDPGGSYLLVGNQRSSTVSLFSIDRATGALSHRGLTELDAPPYWVGFAP